MLSTLLSKLFPPKSISAEHSLCVQRAILDCASILSRLPDAVFADEITVPINHNNERKPQVCLESVALYITTNGAYPSPAVFTCDVLIAGTPKGCFDILHFRLHGNRRFRDAVAGWVDGFTLGVQTTKRRDEVDWWTYLQKRPNDYLELIEHLRTLKRTLKKLESATIPASNPARSSRKAS